MMERSGNGSSPPRLKRRRRRPPSGQAGNRAGGAGAQRSSGGSRGRNPRGRRRDSGGQRRGNGNRGVVECAPAGTPTLEVSGVLQILDQGHGYLRSPKIDYSAEATDAVVIAGTLITTLQTLVSRETNPLHPSVVTIGKIEAGSAGNVIAEEAELCGSIRTSLDESR